MHDEERYYAYEHPGNACLSRAALVIMAGALALGWALAWIYGAG